MHECERGFADCALQSGEWTLEQMIRRESYALPDHSHSEGQIFCVRRGLLAVQTANGHWVMPRECVGWIPPGHIHNARTFAPIQGILLRVSAPAAARLPEHPTAFRSSPLIAAMIDWLSDLDLDHASVARVGRVIDVFLDELDDSRQEALHLPLPERPGLLRVALEVLEDPSVRVPLGQLARRAGESERSFTRHFHHETGLPFRSWCQLARLHKALAYLSAGEPVAATAFRLGYLSPSAFVESFRRHFGHPPARYLAESAAAKSKAVQRS
jgi:AraC-like DNA-binding protein